MDGIRQRARKIGVGDRARRDPVHRSADRVVSARMQHHSSQVLDMNPWHPLPCRCRACRPLPSERELASRPAPHRRERARFQFARILRERQASLPPSLRVPIPRKLRRETHRRRMSVHRAPRRLDRRNSQLRTRTRAPLAGVSDAAIALTRLRVPTTRLSRIRRFFSSVQRPSKTGSPARLKTTSTPRIASAGAGPPSGFQACASTLRDDAGPRPDCDSGRQRLRFSRRGAFRQVRWRR